MKTIITCLVFSLSMLLMSGSCDKNVEEVEKDTTSGELPAPMKIDMLGVEASMADKDQAFAFEFFSHVFAEERAGDDESFMVSPFSLSMALAMTLNGAGCDTKTAIQNTIGFQGRTDVEVNNYFKKLKDAFEKTDPSTQLAIANSIWTNRDMKILPQFISLNQDYYNATVESVDFGNTATVERINKWAADNTRGLIDKVIEEINPNDLMYLLNAVYFKGVWVWEFDKEKTSKMSFVDEDGIQTKVDMMYQEARFRYVEDDTMQVIELPYGNKAFSMLVLLPKKDKKLTSLTEVLKTEDYWSNLKSKMHTKKVDLFIPKFKTEYSKKLNDVLADMGMGVAFAHGKADFSLMSNRDAYISLVSQDTYIATDEVGTEAAAVTSVGITVTSFPPRNDKVVFKADRPFVYIIQEKSSGTILFMGAVKKL